MASAPSPRGIPNGPPGARLCDACRVAHDALLRDDKAILFHSVDNPLQQAREALRRDERSIWVEVMHGGVPRLAIFSRGMTEEYLPLDVLPGLPRLWESAQAGCDFCAFLREAILSEDVDDVCRNEVGKSIEAIGPSEISIRLLLGIKPWRDGPTYEEDPGFLSLHDLMVSVFIESVDVRCNLYFTIEAAADCPAVADWLVLQPPSTICHADEETISFLIKALEEEDHTLRPENQDTDPKHGGETRPLAGHDLSGAEKNRGSTKFLPERLIDVGGESLRLVRREDIHSDRTKQSQYAALSYCWGPLQDAKFQSKAFKANLQQHYEKLEFDSLSPILKDAIEVTRKLSIPYLWVDCLCILQDDFSDWQRQCKQMSDIYGKARVTLITTASRTCIQGFLNPARRGLRFPYKSKRRPNVEGYFMIYFTHVSSVKDDFENSPIESLNNDLRYCQWARRGWTFQEEAMAGARIIFGKNGTYIGCGEMMSKVKTDETGVSTRMRAGLLPRDDNKLHDTWQDLCARYTHLTTSSFTKSTDLLPALSGLSRLYGDRLCHEGYIAGHWVTTLYYSLMWTRPQYMYHKPPLLKDLVKSYDRKPFVLPTWSCLAQGNINCYTSEHCRPEISMIEPHAQIVGDDPYGAIQDAWLHLEGFVLDLPSFSWSESAAGLVGSRGAQTDNICFDANDYRLFAEDSIERPRRFCFEVVSDPLIISPQRYRIDLDFKATPGCNPLLGEIGNAVDELIYNMTLLLLGGATFGAKSPLGYGLVMIPVDEGSEVRCFRRVGVWHYIPDEETYGNPGRLEGETEDLTCMKRLMKKVRINLF